MTGVALDFQFDFFPSFLLFFLKVNFSFNVPFKYLIRFFTAVMSSLVGPLLFWDNNATADAMSGLVWLARYANLPIALLYGHVRSNSVVESTR